MLVQREVDKSMSEGPVNGAEQLRSHLCRNEKKSVLNVRFNTDSQRK